MNFIRTHKRWFIGGFVVFVLALLIWLIDPDLLRRTNCERIVVRFQSFYCFMNSTLQSYIAPSAIRPMDASTPSSSRATNTFTPNSQA